MYLSPVRNFQFCTQEIVIYIFSIYENSKFFSLLKKIFIHVLLQFIIVNVLLQFKVLQLCSFNARAPLFCSIKNLNIPYSHDNVGDVKPKATVSQLLILNFRYKPTEKLLYG